MAKYKDEDIKEGDYWKAACLKAREEAERMREKYYKITGFEYDLIDLYSWDELRCGKEKDNGNVG